MTAVIPIERLLEITAALAGAVSQEQVFEAIVEGVSRAVGASSAGLWLLGEDESTARLVHCHGYSESNRQQLLELPIGRVPAVPVAESMRRGEPIWISSVAQLLEQYPHLSALVTPARSYRVDCLP